MSNKLIDLLFAIWALMLWLIVAGLSLAAVLLPLALIVYIINTLARMAGL